MSDKSRRKLLKSIAAGSGAIVAGKSLPESWSRPVVDSVMLPAHAQTSPIGESGGSSGDIVNQISSIHDNDSMQAEISDLFISPAQAASPNRYMQSAPQKATNGVAPAAFIQRYTVCVKQTSVAGVYTVEVMYLEKTSDDLYTQTFASVQSVDLSVGETKVIPASSLQGSCGGSAIDDMGVTLDSYSSGSGSVTVSGFGGGATINFSLNGCMLDAVTCANGPI